VLALNDFIPYWFPKWRRLFLNISILPLLGFFSTVKKVIIKNLNAIANELYSLSAHVTDDDWTWPDEEVEEPEEAKVEFDSEGKEIAKKRKIVVKNSTYIRFPSTLGVSGMVFQEGKVYV
jgi:hypothetical protein